jgi:hypothetical protein
MLVRLQRPKDSPFLGFLGFGTGFGCGNVDIFPTKHDQVEFLFHHDTHGISHLYVDSQYKVKQLFLPGFHLANDEKFGYD